MQQALLVDRNYMALSIISWQKAIKLIVKGKAEAIETKSKIVIKGILGAVKIPTILRLVIDIPWRAHKSRMRFTRRNVMVRDDYRCQYCNKKLGKTNGTIDHVIPKIQSGQTTYNNCVACCKECNHYKSGRTPEEAGMRLITMPTRPSFLILYKHYLNENSPEEWSDYIIGLKDEDRV